MTVNEPTSEDTIKILNGIRDKYEAHHNVKITDEAIESAVNLSVRYINDRFLPDKAIDLIDEASSRVKMRMYTEPDNLKQLQEEIEVTKNEKEEAIRTQNFEKAASLRDDERTLKEKLQQEQEKWKNKNTRSVTKITSEDIAEVIANWTKIPVKKLTQDENKKLKNLEKTLHERVVGQTEAVTAVAKAIRRGRVGLKDPKRPIGSFTGYVGFDDGGQLTEKVRRRPYCVILFDEIEKAHPDVMNMLLQILEDGRLTDATGRTVNFKNAVIIMTSNVGARLITDTKTLGFTRSDEDTKKDEQRKYEETKKEVLQELKKQFRPEFLNRIDEIIVFHKLTDEEIESIIDIMLKEVTKRMQENNNIELKIDKTVKEMIAKKGVDKAYGARPLRRTIQNELEDKLAEEILDGNIKAGTKAKVSVKDNKITVKLIK